MPRLRFARAHYGIYNPLGGATNPYPVLAGKGTRSRWRYLTTSSGAR